jgi:hypothetical protein
MNNVELGYFATAVAAGVDSFERRSSGGKGILDDEGLIPLYLGRELVEEKAYTDWQAVEADLAALRSAIGALADSPRRDFLGKLLESLTMAVLLFQGHEYGYEEKLTRLVGIPAEPIDRAFLDSLEDSLKDDLSRAGFGKGSLKDRVRAWENEGFLPPEKLQGIYTALMLEAKARTDRMIAPTGDYLMELNPVQGVHYTARCSFAKRKMDLNMGNRFTRPAMKHLVTHEIFPGHSTQNIYTVDAYTRGLATADVLLCSLNGITGVLQEGIGDQGLEMIEWIEGLDDEIYATLTRYRSAVSTQAAWMINVDKSDDDTVRGYLRDVGVMQEARVRGRITMAHHAYRAPFIASYFYGNEAVRRVRRTVEGDAARRASFIKDLYGNMHSPESLCRSNGVEYRSYGDN